MKIQLRYLKKKLPMLTMDWMIKYLFKSGFAFYFFKAIRPAKLYHLKNTSQ